MMPTAALPAHLDYFAVFNENRDVAVSAVERTHAGVGLGVGVDVVLDEVFASPFEPIAEFACKGQCGDP